MRVDLSACRQCGKALRVVENTVVVISLRAKLLLGFSADSLRIRGWNFGNVEWTVVSGSRCCFVWIPWRWQEVDVLGEIQECIVVLLCADLVGISHESSVV